MLRGLAGEGGGNIYREGMERKRRNGGGRGEGRESLKETEGR